MSIVLGSYNVLRKNDAATVSGDLHQLEKEHHVQLMALQEVQNVTSSAGHGVDDFVRRMGWSQYSPREAMDLAIVWNPDVWRAEPFFGVRKLNDRGPVKFTPPKFVIWHGLYHRASQTRHLIYSTHVMRGYAQAGPGAAQPQAWLDEAARTGLLRLVALSAGHQAERPDYWFHHLLGDLNCRQNNRDRWWYPHPILESIYAWDTIPGSMDYMLHSHASVDHGLKVRRRYRTRGGMDSDHAAQVKSIRV